VACDANAPLAQAHQSGSAKHGRDEKKPDTKQRDRSLARGIVHPTREGIDRVSKHRRLTGNAYPHEVDCRRRNDGDANQPRQTERGGPQVVAESQASHNYSTRPPGGSSMLTSVTSTLTSFTLKCVIASICSATRD